MSVKSYKEGLAFIVAMTLKDITNHSLKIVKLFHNSLSHLKPKPHFIRKLAGILKPSRLVKRNLPPP